MDGHTKDNLMKEHFLLEENSHGESIYDRFDADDNGCGASSALDNIFRNHYSSKLNNRRNNKSMAASESDVSSSVEQCNNTPMDYFFERSSSIKPVQVVLSQSNNNVESSASKETETVESEFVCKLCKKVFKSEPIVLAHIEKHYRCAYCLRFFFRYQQLRNHIIIGHMREKHYKCEQCGKEFFWSSHLTRHMRLHSGVKPYPCTLCDKTFTQAAHLTRHIRAHSNVKAFECLVCEKTFTQLGNLKMHLRMHAGLKPYACTECSKTYAQLGNLKTHMRLHTGVKPSDCLELNVLELNENTGS